MATHQGLARRVLKTVALVGVAVGCSNTVPMSDTGDSFSRVVPPDSITATAPVGTGNPVASDVGTAGSSAPSSPSTSGDTSVSGTAGTAGVVDATGSDSTASPAGGGTAGVTDTGDAAAEVMPTAPVVEEPAADAPTLMTFTVTTEPFQQSGRRSYSPRNIGAIWVETRSGEFVKTLKMWANRRKQHLSAFNGAAGGDTTDATTSATLSRHQTHTVEWDFTDSSGAEVEDGDYQIRVEGTEIDGAGPTANVPFSKDGSSDPISVGDDGHFLDMSIAFD